MKFNTKDPQTGKRYNPLSYGIAVAVYALRMMPRFVFTAVDAAKEAFEATTNTAKAFEATLGEPQGPTIAAMTADGTLPAPTGCEWPDCGFDTNASNRAALCCKAQAFANVTNGDPNAQPMTREDVIETVERLRSHGVECNGEYTREDLRAHIANSEVTIATKPKRVRVRSPKLFACDVYPGAYVPKRGNDKTPNFRVTAVVMDEANDVPTEAVFDRGEGTAPTRVPVADFLALVARRVDA